MSSTPFFPAGGFAALPSKIRKLPQTARSLALSALLLVDAGLSAQQALATAFANVQEGKAGHGVRTADAPAPGSLSAVDRNLFQSWCTVICVQKSALRLFCPGSCPARSHCLSPCSTFLALRYTACCFRIACRTTLLFLLRWKQRAPCTVRGLPRLPTGPCVLCSALQMHPCSRIFI